MKSFLLLTLLGASVTASAQPGGLLRKRALGNDSENPNRRNDLEGGIWEYKVIERTGDKQTVLVGKLRVKQSAAFDVAGSAKGSLLEGQQEDEQAPAKAKRPFGPQSQSPRRLGVLDRVAEGNRGGERIADVTYERSRSSSSANKVIFKFDTDDEHPLSGEAQVKYDTREGGGLWRGSYYEALPDKKKKRWNFELRFIED